MDVNETNLKFHLPSTENANPCEHEQYFVMQNDNDTLTISRQPVQYITQVPTANDNLSEARTEYIQQQEYYVHDSAAFVISDCLSTNNAEEAESGNEDYLIHNADLQSQETEATNENVTKEEMDISHNVTDADILGMSNGTTEITLNQEQWEMMERNGWVLLELNSKIYLLDTLGLHDISDNPDLIQSLKNEIAFSTQELQQPEITSPDISINAPAKDTITLSEQDNSLIETSNLNKEHDELQGVEIAAKEEAPVSKPQARRVIRKKSEFVRFKTKLKLEEIPEKFVLGTTVNGKRLVAKIVKKPKPIKKLPDKNVTPPDIPPPDITPPDIPTPEIPIDSREITANTDSEKARVDQYFKNFLHNTLTPPQKEDIQKAESVINQLLCIQSTRDRLIKQNLLVTKNVPTTGVECPPNPVQVSGCVVSAGHDTWRFEYETQLLQRIMSQKLNKGLSQQKDAIVHVHIEETKQSEDGLTKTSITINKQNIRLLPMQPRKLVHACTACANLFETEEDLKEHRKKTCAKLRNNPEKMFFKDLIEYFIVKPKEGGNPKSYVCKNCNIQITKTSSLRKHITTHIGPKLHSQEEVQKELHECTICPSVFYHKSTLSKHFLNCHVRKSYQYNN